MDGRTVEDFFFCKSYGFAKGVGENAESLDGCGDLTHFFTSALRQFRIASSHIRKFMTNQGFQIRTLRGFRAYFLFPIKISNGGFAICYSHSAKSRPCISLVAFLFLFLRNKAPPPQRQVRLTAAAIGHTAGFQSFSPAIKNRPCFCHL